MLVCWDNWFTESARAQRLKGAEILLPPIAADGVPDHWDVVSRTRAIDNGVFLVASSTYATSPSRLTTHTARCWRKPRAGLPEPISN
jgi:predicted amidohydrolase